MIFHGCDTILQFNKMTILKEYNTVRYAVKNGEKDALFRQWSPSLFTFYELRFTAF
jgi:hypothetical protein